MKRFWPLLFLLLFSTRLISADEELPEIRQITTHPQMDVQPAVSPDGKWLAFVSSRSGNLDIWIRPLPQGRAIQITQDRSEDLQPAWMPDSRSLVFMSKRRDALGDIWRINIDRKTGRIKGHAEQLTHHLGMDQLPAVSPDGRYIAYVSDMHQGFGIHILDLNTRKTQLLTSGSTEPAWSPDGRWLAFTAFPASAYGDLMIAFMPPFYSEGRARIQRFTSGKTLDGQAKWSPDGQGIVFQRIHKDTNGDGRLSPEDYGSLWEKPIKTDKEADWLSQPEYQITSDIYNDLSPCRHDSLLYFSSNRGGGEDIWTMPAHGLISDKPDVEEQYMAVFNRFGLVISHPALQQAILGYQHVLTKFSKDSIWCARALIRIGEIHVLLGQNDAALKAFKTVRQEYGHWPRESAEAMVKEASVPVGDTFQRIALCLMVIEWFPEQTFSVNEARLLSGDLYRSLGDAGNSLAAYSAVAQSGSRYGSLIAQAKLKIGDLFSDGQAETARQSYLAVLREYGDTPLWRQRATQRIMDQVQGSLSDRIAGYQDIQLQGADLPALVVEAQLAIGRDLMESEQYNQAIRELEQVDFLAPDLEWAHAKSRLMLASAYQKQNDFLKARQFLEEVIKNYAVVEGGRFGSEARDALFELTFNTAEQLKATGDFSLAAARYQMALELRPEEIRVHRGLIESAYQWQRQRQNGKLDSLIQYYQQELQKKPDRPVFQYSLGLALSYAGERSLSGLEKSNMHLMAALEMDYRMIYPYRTLGYNYELMEHLAEIEKNRKSGILERVLKVPLTPVRWVIHLFRDNSEKGPAQYYEKAIEVLTTAIELNNVNENPYLEAELAQNLANNFYNLGEYGFHRAYRYYQQRLSIDTTFASPLEKAIFFSRAGHCALGLDEFNAAESYLKKSIALFEILGRESFTVQDQGRLAYLYQNHGDYQEAISFYELLAGRNERQRRWEALIRDYRNIAYNYHLLWEPEDAILYAEKAEKVLETRSIPKGPPEKSYLRWEFMGLSIPIWGLEEIGSGSSEGFTLAEEAALIYILISKNAERIKDFTKAFVYEEKRYAIFSDRKDRLAQRISRNRMGMLLMKQGQYDEAWMAFFDAWEMSRKAEDDRGRWMNAINLGNVASIQMTAGIVDHFERSRQILLQESRLLEAPGSETELQGIFSTLGSLCYYEWKMMNAPPKMDVIPAAVEKLKKLSEADLYFKKSLGLAEQEDLWREQAILLKSRAEIAALSGETEYAVKMLLRAEDIFEREGETIYLWRVQYALARLSSGLTQDQRDSLRIKDSMAYYRLAIETLELQPVSEEDSELRLSDRSDRLYLYTDAAMTFAAAGDVRISFETVERGRQKRTADVLARRPPVFRRERHNNLWRNLRDVRAQTAAVRDQILSMESDRKSAARLETLEDRSRFLQDEYTLFLGRIQDEDPVLAYLSGAAPVQCRDLQDALQETQGVLSYILCPDGILIHTIDHESVRHFYVAVNMDSLQEIMEEFNTHLTEKKDPVYSVSRLSGWLLSPVQEWLETRSHLIIIPDQFLWEIPFELLRLDGEQLLDFYTVSYAPSLMAYRMARDRRKINQSDLLIAGDTWDKTLADAIGASEVLLGSAATESKLKSAAAEADMIHIERWMLPNERSPLQSAIILFSHEEEDGYIRPEELFSWDLPVSFVKLPIARTLPYYQSLEMMIYALLYNSVPSLMIGRWRQPAEAVTQFFQPFYQHLNQWSLCESFTQTCLQLRDDLVAPDIWGGYSLIGYEGMNKTARLAFARQNLVSTVITGRNYVELGEYNDAVAQFEQALIMAESLKDTASIRGIMLEIIRTGMEGELWAKAIVYQRRMVSLFGAAANLGVARQNLVTFYFRNGQFGQAADTKKEVLEEYRNRNQWPEFALGAMELAVIYASAREYDASIQWADQAYMSYQSLDDQMGKARSLIWKGRSLLDSDRYFEARATFSLAIEIVQKVNPENRSRLNFELATAYQLRGICLENLSLYQEAIEDQKRAFDLLDERHPLQKAQAHQYLANVYWKMGAYREALMYQENALKALESLGQRKHLAMAHSTQGLIQMSLGDIAGAKVSEDKAFQLAREIKSLEDEATILKNMGQVAIQEGDLETAYQYFQQATEIDSGLGLRRGLSYDFRNQGMLLIQMQSFARAVQILTKGLALADSVDDPRNQVHCYYGLGLAHMRMGRFNEGLAAVDSGLAIAGQLIVPELTWRLYRQRGQIYWALRNRDAALKDFQQAVDIVEKMRAELKVESFKQGFFDSKMELYQDIIRLLLEMQQRTLAFHYVERAKSRDFIDLLTNQRLTIPSDQQELLIEEKNLKMRIQEARNQIVHLGGFHGRDEKQTWEDSLIHLQESYESLMVSMQASNPELASFVSVDPLTVEQIQTALPPGSVLLEYYWGPESGYCWVISAEDIKLALIHISQEKLVQSIQSLRENLISHLSVDQESRLLYQWLIAPVSGFIADASHLVIIPHGVLHYLPFAVLQNEDGDLIDRFSISLAPSTTVLGYCLEKGGSLQYDSDQMSVTAFGNPDLGDPALNLEFAEKELSALEWAFPVFTGYTGKSASEHTVKETVGNEHILHFACHATYEPDAPLFSALLLGSGSDEDGRLEVHEIFGLHLNCDLVALSACETGLGQVTTGDEIIGLSRSFIYAGTPSILTSLWKVDDLATAVMMKRFYRYLAAGNTRAEALRQAQLIVRELVNPHPSAWAAFNITGDFR